MNGWNWLDFFIFLIFFLNIMMGMARGASKEVMAAMCLIVALIFTIKFTIPLAAFFNKSPLINNVIDTPIVQNFMEVIGAGPLTVRLLAEIFYCIALLICFVGVYSICSALLHFSGFNEVFGFTLGTMNRKVGGTFGLARGYVVTLILLVVLTHIFNKENNSRMDDSLLTGSTFARFYQPSVRLLDKIIREQNAEKYREIYHIDPERLQQVGV